MRSDVVGLTFEDAGTRIGDDLRERRRRRRSQAVRATPAWGWRARGPPPSRRGPRPGAAEHRSRSAGPLDEGFEVPDLSLYRVRGHVPAVAAPPAAGVMTLKRSRRASARGTPVARSSNAPTTIMIGAPSPIRSNATAVPSSERSNHTTPPGEYAYHATSGQLAIVKIATKSAVRGCVARPCVLPLCTNRRCGA
jgi:hypothetical protein